MTDGRLDVHPLRQLRIALAMIIVMLLHTRPVAFARAWQSLAQVLTPPAGNNMADTSRRSGALKVAGISKRFGGLQALSDVGITIGRGQVYGLIEPNWRQQDDVLQRHHGPVHARLGHVRLAGRPYEPTAVTKGQAGSQRAFQNIRLFADATALENY